MPKEIVLERTQKEHYNDVSGDYSYLGDTIAISIKGEPDQELVDSINEEIEQLKKIFRRPKLKLLKQFYMQRYINVDWATFRHCCLTMKLYPLRPNSCFQVEITVTKKCKIFLVSPALNFDYNSFK